MKTTKNTFLLLISIVVMGAFQACSNNDPQPVTKEQQFLKQIAGTWKSEVVMYDGIDVTRSFAGLSIVFDEAQTITVTNPVPPIWKSSGSFVLVPSGNSFQLKRNDGLTVTAEPLSEKLVLTFQYDAAALTGRTNSVKGNFVFELKK
jgi:hypothetical protein